MAVIGPLLYCVNAYAVNSRYLVSATRVLPMQLLKRMLFFFTVLLLTIGFHLGWTAGGRVTLLGATLFMPDAMLAPVLMGTYLIRDVPGSARWGCDHLTNAGCLADCALAPDQDVGLRCVRTDGLGPRYELR